MTARDLFNTVGWNKMSAVGESRKGSTSPSTDTKPIPFRLRIQLLNLSQKLRNEDNQRDTELDVMKSFFRNRMPAEQYNNITKGYELFAYLEENHLISEDNLQALELPLGECGRGGTLERLLREGESESVGCPLRGGVMADLEVYSPTDTSKVEEPYRQCLARVGNSIATSDGSLAELVYLCPELPLSYLDSKKVSNAHELFRHLEQKGLISCWKLSYLYCRLWVLQRKDLCKEVEQYVDKARMRKPHIPTLAERTSQDFVRSYSYPEGVQPKSNLLKASQVDSLPASLPRLKRQDSITQQDNTGPCVGMDREGTEGQGGGRDADVESTDGPLVRYPPDDPHAIPCPEIDKPVVQQSRVVDVTQNTDQPRHRTGTSSEHKRHLLHTRLPDAPGATPDIAFLNKKVYKWLQWSLLWNVTYGFLCALIALVAVMMVVKLLLELSICDCGTAVLNLVGRGVTHLVVPTITIHIMVQIAEDPDVGKMRILYTSREAELVFEAVIEKLSSHKELEQLTKISSVTEKVNNLLNSKLSSIMVASLLQSTIFFAELAYIGAANFPHFEGLASHVAAVCRLVLIFGAFFIHLVTGVAVCLYLFEMRLREYLARVVDEAHKKQLKSVEQDAKEARKIILKRWSTFQTVMTFLSLTHILLLMYSIWSATPFRCYGDSVTFNEEELKQVPLSWILWIMISLLCHAGVYNCFGFTTGRVIAVFLQLFSMLLCLMDKTSPKWGLMIQIANVVYPCASLFWIHVLACRSIYVKATLSHSRENCKHKHCILLVYNLLTHVRFLFHAIIAVVIFFVVPIAVYREHTLLTKGVHPVR